MTSLCTEQSHQSAPGLQPDLPRFRTRVQPIQAILRTLAAWQARNETRAKLRRMPDYLLRDVGLSADYVREETEKPFWRP